MAKRRPCARKLEAAGEVVSRTTVPCRRSRRPFCCGWPGSIRSGNTPAFTTFTANGDRPPAPHRTKRWPVVRTQHTRQPILPERRLQNRPGMCHIRLLQPLAAQQITAIRIRQRQGIAPLPVATVEPTLQVDTPHIVRTPTGGKGGPSAAGLEDAYAATPPDPPAAATPRCCSRPATEPQVDVDPGRPGSSSDPTSDAYGEAQAPTPPPPHSDPADDDAAHGSGPKVPQPPPADTGFATCTPSFGSPRNTGSAPETDASSSFHSNINFNRSSMAQVSFQGMGTSLPMYFTCYLCPRSILLPMSPVRTQSPEPYTCPLHPSRSACLPHLADPQC